VELLLHLLGNIGTAHESLVFGETFPFCTTLIGKKQVSLRAKKKKEKLSKALK